MLHEGFYGTSDSLLEYYVALPVPEHRKALRSNRGASSCPNWLYKLANTQSHCLACKIWYHVACLKRTMPPEAQFQEKVEGYFRTFRILERTKKLTLP